MSLVKLLSGRKRDSVVWEYFSFEEATQKSLCLVMNLTSDKPCGTILSGKNSSNLVAHLSRFHPKEHSEYLEADKVKRLGKVGLRVKQKAADDIGPCTSQTIEACLRRRIISWPTESHEHKQRMEGLIDMIVSTSSPMTLIDNSSFKHMIETLDPKFSLPGKR